MGELRGQAVVAAIGVFDGVHLGHQALLTRAREMATAQGAQVGVVTFDPPPVVLFAPPSEPFQLTPLKEKKAVLRRYGAARIRVLPFTADLAAQSARAFAAGPLREGWSLAGVVIGEDFSFGAGRAGHAGDLRELGRELGFAVAVVPAVELLGARVSSTRIRTLLREGRVEEAARLLGHLLSLEGRVVPGQGIGARSLLPTANLEVDPEQLLPGAGVYLVETHVGDRCLAGVAHVGPALTTGSGHERLIEVHLLDYQGELKGRRLRVDFVSWLRATRRFPDLTALRQAIEGDIAAARRRLEGGTRNRVVPYPPL